MGEPPHPRGQLAFTFSVDSPLGSTGEMFAPLNLNAGGLNLNSREELTRLLLMPLQQQQRPPSTAPANEQAIERLERVPVDPDEKSICAVCLDEITAEATCARIARSSHAPCV